MKSDHDANISFWPASGSGRVSGYGRAQVGSCVQGSSYMYVVFVLTLGICIGFLSFCEAQG